MLICMDWHLMAADGLRLDTVQIRSCIQMMELIGIQLRQVLRFLSLDMMSHTTLIASDGLPLEQQEPGKTKIQLRIRMITA